MSQSETLSTEEQAFMQGVGIVLAALVRDYDLPSVAKGIMLGFGISVDTLSLAGMEETELKIVRTAAEA